MTKQIQIAALVPYKIFPAKMGGQKAVALFYNYIGALLPVTIISVKNNELPPQFNAKFIPALGNSVLRYVNPFLFFRIKKILRENKATHFIIEHPYFGWLGILLQWFLPVCLVVRSHNIEAFRFKSIGKWWWKILWHYEKYTHQYAGLNFFITEEDRLFAIKEFKLEPKKCHNITYGFESLQKPSAEQINSAKITLQQKHSITVDEKILLFNGTLNYKPNHEALDIILHQLNPLLMAQKTFSYKIIICGKNLPESVVQLKNKGVDNIIYAGFVEDVSIYFEGADIFINPVITGGGIKTKLIEALGANLSCISTASGAEGIPAEITGGKLIVVPDNNWQAFAAAIETIDIKKNTPPLFYTNFYWGNIAEKAAEIIKANCTN